MGSQESQPNSHRPGHMEHQDPTSSCLSRTPCQIDRLIRVFSHPPTRREGRLMSHESTESSVITLYMHRAAQVRRAAGCTQFDRRFVDNREMVSRSLLASNRSQRN